MLYLWQKNKIDYVHGPLIQRWALFRQDASYFQERMGQSGKIWHTDIYACWHGDTSDEKRPQTLWVFGILGMPEVLLEWKMIATDKTPPFGRGLLHIAFLNSPSDIPTCLRIVRTWFFFISPGCIATDVMVLFLGLINVIWLPCWRATMQPSFSRALTSLLEETDGI